MLENEIRMLIEKHDLQDLEVVWIKRGYHDKPEELGRIVQEEIRRVEKSGADEILIAYGLCGNGALGWVSESARLVMPRFDDCINMILCPKKRTCRSLIETGRFYLTEGWCIDESSLGHMVDRAVERYGRKRGIRVKKQMLSSYHHITVIDTGCYELGPVKEYADRCAEMLGFVVDITEGSTHVLEKLLAGPWDEDILIKEPGVPVRESDFAFVMEDNK